MKLIIDVPAPVLEQIREALEYGGYADPEAFALTALQNQIRLEIDESDVSNLPTFSEALAESESAKITSDGGGGVRTYPPSRGTNSRPTSLTVEHKEYENLPAVPPPATSRLNSGPLWGQYNRIFPVKLLVRALANEIAASREDSTPSEDKDKPQEGWIDRARFVRACSQLAREVGFTIQQVDREKSRGRGEKLAAGLPVGQNAVKSKDRFASQFIGYVEQDGGLVGAATHLQFVNISAESEPLIGLTNAGLEFASLWNPLLDGDYSADRTLSEEEVEFYLRHVLRCCPDEFEAMHFVAQALLDGDDRPEELTARVNELNDQWSDATASTMRSGLIARMFELGFIERSRVGQRGVAYHLTQSGESFLSTTASSNASIDKK
ncbi:hypothetical protein [Haloferax sulfurifontis]|uniref:hypothetical protein n=1 Tax=Haloferax sulfurifontis TaxID=255616 RepID=UPI001268AE4C|nr:hypothetical protein [Haloferax sulfurifontis]